MYKYLYREIEIVYSVLGRLTGKMAKRWEEFWTQEVASNEQINLPSKLEERIGSSKPLEGFVQWSVDKQAEVMVISNRKLQKDRYESIDHKKVTGTGQIRPPNEVQDEIPDPVYRGVTVFFLVHEGMLDDDPETPNSAYLLTEAQAREFLNEVELTGDSLRNQLQSTPAFLPPVR